MGNETDPKTQTTETVETGKKPTYETWDAYLATLDEPLQKLYTEHVASLKKALDTERTDRQALAKQISELQPKAEKGSDLEKQLGEMSNKLQKTEADYQAAQKRASFAEQAGKTEVGCSNPKAAFALATAENLFNDDGSPKWEDLRKAAPELFVANSTTDAGKTSTTSDPASSPNDFIRGSTGRG